VVREELSVVELSAARCKIAPLKAGIGLGLGLATAAAARRRSRT
jgi:hypothetical protein